MGKLKKFLRKKQRKSKASKTRKKRQRNNNRKNDAFMKSKKDYELPSPKPVSEDYLATLSSKAMAAFGVTPYSHSYYQPPYTGSPVLNSGADPKNWNPFMKSKKDYELPSPKPVSEDYLATLSSKAKAGVTTYSHSYY